MRRWRKNKVQSDDVITFDDDAVDSEDESEEEEPVVSRRKASIPRPFRTRFSDESDDGDDEVNDNDDSVDNFDKLEPLIRAGKYKPKQSDPYTVHILYQTLRDLGEIK